MILKNHDALRQDNFNLSHTITLLHEISLKTEKAVHVRQFKILDAHRQELERHITKWLKLGII
jgi:hypothetical protein